LTLLPAGGRPPDLGRRLETYVDNLLEANQAVNLVSRQDTERHVVRFTQESLFLAARLLQEPVSSARLLDIGSGGGFPGLVLKLALPHVEATLVEGTQKKARFLAQVCEELDLHGITILWARAESLADRKAAAYRPDLRHAIDWVTAKAVGTLRETLDLAAPFLAPGGILWTFKGAGLSKEVCDCRQRLAQLGCEVMQTQSIALDSASYLVAIKRCFT
jgi:16S rRNA (guanine527-N7)-methyltransferase